MRAGISDDGHPGLIRRVHSELTLQVIRRYHCRADTADTTPISSRDKWHFAFFDGGSIEYDRSTGTLSIVTTGPTNLTSDGPVMVKVPEVTVDSPQTTFTGGVKVQGPFVFEAGMSGKGGAGGGAAIQIEGDTEFKGQVSANGKRIGESHVHVNPEGGDTGSVT